MYSKKTILLVDDHDSIISGLKYEISQKFKNIKIFVAKDIRTALSELRNKKILIAVIDVSFGNDVNDDGIELCKKIKMKDDKIKLIAYSGFVTRRYYLKKLLDLKVDAVVSKSDGNVFVLNTIERILTGKTPMHSPDVLDVKTKLDVFEEKKRSIFTRTERKVLDVLYENELKGHRMKNDDIAEFLNIKKTTLKVHIANIHKKLGVHKRADLIEIIKDH